MSTDYQTRARAATTPAFELKRFGWVTPDRLELSGTFADLDDAPVDAAPALVVRAGDSVYRLSAVADSLKGPPEEGHLWQGQFAWQDPPVAFDVAELHLGAGLVVQLPEPGAKRLLSRTRVLQVRTARPGEHEPGGAAAASVGSQVELLAAQEEAREAQVAMEQTQGELSRARDDLRAERERRAGDSERFREGLAKVRESAEKGLAAERSTSGRLGADLRQAQEAIEAKDATLKTLRGELEALTRAKAEAGAEAQTLRERNAQLERDGKDAERLRTELEQVHGTIEQARGDAERLLGRLTPRRAK